MTELSLTSSLRQCPPMGTFKKSLKRWLGAAALAVLIHCLLVLKSWQLPVRKPMPVELSTITKEQLQKVKQDWKKKERSLLLSKNLKDTTLPLDKDKLAKLKDAKFFSDRDRVVEKETRASQTQVIPKAGSPTESGKLDLSKLGVSIPLDDASTQQFQKNKKALARDRKKTQPEQKSEIGGDQAILDRDLPQSGENLLNTVESRYYSFYSRLYEAIGPLWQSRIAEIPLRRDLAPGDYTTTVEVILDQNGRLIGIEHVKNSGVDLFDQAVDDAWNRIGKFPNPPQALLNAKGVVRTGWSFNVQIGQNRGLQLAPPERKY